MRYTKSAIKFILRRNIVLLLLAANICAFVFTNSVFSSYTQAENTGKKGFVSQMYTGWQMLDWSFSLIDYFRNVSDR